MHQHKSSTSHQRSLLPPPPVPVLLKEQRKTGSSSGKCHIFNERGKADSWPERQRGQMGLCNRGERVSGSRTDPICAVRNFWGVHGIARGAGKRHRERGKDGEMELPEFPSSPVFLAVRVFYQLDNLQLDPLPVFKLSPSVFLNTKFNPRNDDTDRKNPAY